MDSFGQGQQRPAGAAVRVDHERPLLRGRALCGGVIEWDESNDWCTQVPGDFGATVVKARVVAIEHQLHVLAIDPQLPIELVERGARVPQPDEVGAGYQQHLRRAGQDGAMIGRRDVGS